MKIYSLPTGRRVVVTQTANAHSPLRHDDAELFFKSGAATPPHLFGEIELDDTEIKERIEEAKTNKGYVIPVALDYLDKDTLLPLKPGDPTMIGPVGWFIWDEAQYVPSCPEHWAAFLCKRLNLWVKGLSWYVEIQHPGGFEGVRDWHEGPIQAINEDKAIALVLRNDQQVIRPVDLTRSERDSLEKQIDLPR